MHSALQLDHRRLRIVATFACVWCLGSCTSRPPSASGPNASAGQPSSGSPAQVSGAGAPTPAAAGSGGPNAINAAAGMTAVPGQSAGTTPTSSGAAGVSSGASAIAGAGGGGASAGSSTQLGVGGAAGAPATGSCTPPEVGSAGDPCTAPLQPNDDRLCKIMFNGRERQFYIYASPKYDPCTPASLIMDCHGLSESIEVHTGKQGFNLSGQQYPKGYGSGWRMAVQRDNAIVVTPAGIGESWTTSTDVPFVNKAADQVLTIAKVDPERMYMTGISMGGMMTVATGCDDSKRWRGMAPVAMLTQSCSKLERPTPTISFHSMTDSLTSHANDRSTMQRIAEFNKCKKGPTDYTNYGGAMSSSDKVCYVMPNGVGDPDAADPFNVPLEACKTTSPATKCVNWTECDDDVEVVFCTVAAADQPLGGHILYNNDTQLDIAEVAWPFFKKFWK